MPYFQMALMDFLFVVVIATPDKSTRKSGRLFPSVLRLDRLLSSLFFSCLVCKVWNYFRLTTVQGALKKTTKIVKNIEST